MLAAASAVLAVALLALNAAALGKANPRLVLAAGLGGTLALWAVYELVWLSYSA